MGVNLCFKPKLFLTYDNQATVDGVGAQLQRIISVFSISRLAGVGYLHTPLFDIDPQVFSTLSFDERLPQIEAWNNLFSDDLEVFHQAKGQRVFESNKITLIQIRLLRLLSRFSRCRVICKLSNPRIITDKYPDSLLAAPDLMTNSLFDASEAETDEALIIVVHIRQGVLALSQFKDRLLILDHYEKILKFVVDCLNREGIQFKIMIPKENGQDVSLSMSDPEVVLSIELNPNNPSLKFNDDGSINLIHEIPNAELTPILFGAQWLNQSSTYSDFMQMLRADVLITSKSSLSFVAGLLNKNSVKIYTPFWHQPPREWISSENLNEKVFFRMLHEKSAKNSK